MDKVIHYCWFGRGDLPPLAEKCIASWKVHCPDYEIRRWDEDSFDVNSHPYTKQAYELRKFAFVTDYVRLMALVEHGGIYMDTDVEVLKPLDPLLAHPAFSGFERTDVVPTGIMASERGHHAMRDLLTHYDDRPFLKADGEPDLTPNVEPITNYFAGRGLHLNNTYQVVQDVTFYPKHVFCPKDYGTGKITLHPDSMTIHHFAGSWLTPRGQLNMRVYRLLSRLIPGFQKSREAKARKNRDGAS